MGSSSKTLWEHLQEATALLRSAGVREPFASARVLMANVLGLAPAELVLQRECILNDGEVARFWGLVNRRAEGEPVAYILGRCEFFSLELEVSPGVLIPSPDTEHIVEAALGLLRGFNEPIVLDLGTGSGCVAISIAKNARHARVIATDISERALRCAASNVMRHGLSDRVWLLRADVVSCFGRVFDVVVCNPPYVSVSDTKNLSWEVRKYQPAEALFAGRTGFEFIELMLRDVSSVLLPHGYLVFEIGIGQIGEIIRLAGSYGWEIIDVRRDLANIERAVIIRRTRGE